MNLNNHPLTEHPKTAEQAGELSHFSVRPSLHGGVVPVSLSDSPPLTIGPNASLEFSTNWIERVSRLAKRVQPYEARRDHETGLVSIRSPSTLLIGGRSYDSAETRGPTHIFLPTEALAQHLHACESVKGDALSENELLIEMLQFGREFRFDALNELNAAYYSTPASFSKENNLAWMFTRTEEINTAFARCIESLISRNDISLKELCAGNRTRWDQFSRAVGPEKRYSVTLSDHSEVLLPNNRQLPQEGPFTFKKEAYSLFDSFSFLEPEERFDVILVTYGFDSVWLPGDVHYQKEGKEWFKASYRLAFPDWHPERELADPYLQGDSGLSECRINDLKDVVVEVAWERVDLEIEPYGEYLKSRKGDIASVNVPAGLIRRVDEALKVQVKDDGIVIVGETASYHPEKSFASHNGFNRSGLAALYKQDDLFLAELELVKRGYYVDVSTVAAFREKWNGESMEKNDASNQYVMLVSKKPFTYKE